jgi:hypothetical protein
MDNVFEVLSGINVNEHTEDKNGLTYLTWAWAWAEFKKVCPTATYEVEKFDNLPYVYDENTGYMCYTKVTVDDITYEMWLPVMDGANKSMKAHPYEYTIKNPLFKYAKKAQDGKYYDKYGNEQTEYTTKKVEAATMFDINKTIWRCLVKNVAIATGIGLYIFKGEDIPEKLNEETASSPKQQKKSAAQPTPKPFDKYAGLKATINEATDVNTLMSLYLDHEAEITANPQRKQLLTARKLELQTPKAA